MTLTQEHRERRILRGRDVILRQVATGLPIARVLESIAVFAEEMVPEARAAILLVQDGRLVHGAAPSLPADYVRLCDGLAIGPGHGTCGEAAHHGERVVVEDVAGHPSFRGLEQAPRLGGFRASWSQPMLASDGRVLGTFALLHSEPRSPDAFEVELLESMAHVAGIGIEIRRTQASLSESEQRFRQLAEHVQEVFYLTDWRDNRVLYVSPAYERVWGRPASELYERPASWTASIHADDRARVYRAYAEKAARGGFDVHYRILDGKGELRWIHDRAFPILGPDGEVERVCGVCTDVTEQKLREEESEAANRQVLSSLTTELLLAEERERRRLAEDLHDGPCQTLTLALMRLEELVDALPPAEGERLRRVAELVSEANRATRNLSFELSPPVLHDLGFDAAVQWLAENIEQGYGVEIALTQEGPSCALDERVRTLLYRAVRELLINVGKHSRASRADVRLTGSPGLLRVEVVDDGISCDPAELETGRGLGLRTIRERLNHLGGRMEITTPPCGGTSISLYAPLLEDGP